MSHSQKPAPHSSIMKREQSDSHCLHRVAERSQIYIAHGFVAEAAGSAPHWHTTKHRVLDPLRARYAASNEIRSGAVFKIRNGIKSYEAIAINPPAPQASKF